MAEERGWSDVKKGQRAKECRHLWKLEKIRKMSSSLELQKEPALPTPRF